MAMDAILGGKVLINGTDIWKAYGAFLVEKKRGDRNNLKAIMAPAKTKTHVAVDIREEDGEKYSGGEEPGAGREAVLRPIRGHAG